MTLGMPLCALLPTGLPEADSEVAGRETCSGLLLTQENTQVLLAASVLKVQTCLRSVVPLLQRDQSLWSNKPLSQSRA